MRRLLIVAVALVAGFPRVAAADDPDADALFSEGRSLMDEGRYAEACPKLEESQRIAPLLQKRAFLGICHEREGKTATAWRDYMSVAQLADEAGLANRSEKARGLATNLEPKLRKVRVDVAEYAPGEEVTIDDEKITGPFVAAAIPLDPGPHRIAATAQGRESWSTEVRLDEDGQVISVTVPRLNEPQPEAAPRSDSVPRAALPQPPPSPHPIEPVTKTKRFRDFMIAGGLTSGVSVGAVIVGSYFGLHAFKQKADSDANCKPPLSPSAGACTIAGADFMKGAKLSSYISTAAFGVGLAAGAAAVGIFVSGASRVTGVRVEPGGVALQGTW